MLFQFIKDIFWGKRTEFGKMVIELINSNPEEFTIQSGRWLYHPKMNDIKVWISPYIDLIDPSPSMHLSYQDKYYINKSLQQTMYRMKLK